MMTRKESERRLEGARPVRGMRRLEEVLVMPRAEIEELARRAQDHYHSFEKIKRSGKARRIDAPVDPLRAVQRRIKRALIDPVKLPPRMLGGVKGCSPRMNAQAHVGAPVVLTMDIKDCFPSVSNKQVYRVFAERLGCLPDFASLLTLLTTLNGSLPQGTSTSTGLANLALLDLYDELDRIAESLSLQFTMWVDDITFSGDRAREAIEPAVEACRRHGYSLSASKMRVVHCGRRMEVTGIVVNGDAPGTSRSKREAVRRKILALGSQGGDIGVELRSIRGHIAQIRSVKRSQAAPLQRLLDAKLGVAVSRGAKTSA